jgi:DNA polymerase III sliding clamp (beta) subunit (PCNA family)
VSVDTGDILSWLDAEESVKPARQVRAVSTDTLLTQHEAGMCFEVQREVLLSVLNKAVGIVPTRDIIPVHLNFQVKVSEYNLVVVATNGQLSMVVNTSQVACKVEGTQAFPARTLLNIVKETNAGDVVYIEVTSSGAVVVAGSFSAEIALASGKDFPEMTELTDVVFHDVDRMQFVDAISTVRYALPGNDFGGQSSLKMINIKGGKFTVCDGARFQQSRIEGFKLNMKLPGYSITNLLKYLTATDQEMLEIGETAHQIVFRLTNAIFYMNKMSDPYPNVEQLWLRPALSNDQELIVDRQELITAIKQVKFATDNDSNALALIFNGEELKVKTKDTINVGSATIGCKWTGKPRTVVVNYIHFAEMLKAYPEKECKFYLGEDSRSQKSPMLLKDTETLSIATIPQLLNFRAGLTD